MAGRIDYYEGHDPSVGDPVVIVVDEVNRPTGIWTGRLAEILPYDGINITTHVRSARCVAHITDPSAPEMYRGGEWSPR